MTYREKLAKMREARPEPVMVPFVLDDELFHVDVRKLDGMDWAAVTADALPVTALDHRLGFSTIRAALLACEKYSTLHDAEQVPVPEEWEKGEKIPTDWRGIFDEISEEELNAIAALWWGMNSRDPNRRAGELKKALAGGGKTSLS